MLESVLALKELGIQVSDAAGPSITPHYDTADTITVPDAHLLFNGDFKRVGSTGLKITGEDGKSYFIQDYFSGEKHKDLLSPEGAMLSANVVAALAGPLAPGQMAQAGAQPAVQAVVGRVDAISGSCTVVRNGVTVSLNMGDAVRKGDVVQTSASSQISIVFTDGSTFSLSANARMVLDEFVYNAGGGNNSAMINLVQGTFSFVAGQVAKTGDMRVETPVATIGIRGTAVLVEISANDGQTKFSVMVEPNGVTGSFNLYNKTTGALIATVNNSQVGWLVTPSGPLQVVAQAVNKTPADLQQELGIVQQLFNIFNNYQQNPIDPNQQDPGQRGDNQSPQNTGAVGSGGAPSSNQPTTYNVTITQLPGSNVVTPQNPPPLAGTNPNPNPNPSPNPNANTNPDPTNPNTNPSSPDAGGQEPTVPLPTGTFNVIYGTTGNDHIIGTSGDDFVYAGDGDDLITAGHGGGDDFYDGGNGHDKIEFPSSASDITYHLNVGNRTLENGQVVKYSTADGAQTGHDIFVRIEEVVGGQGNDTFVLHDGGNWEIDGGAGNDIIKLADGVSIRDGATTLELSNIEIIDLSAAGTNIFDLDLQTAIDANVNHTLEIRGNAQDAVNFLNNQHEGGQWRLVSGSDYPGYRPGFVKYEFVSDGTGHETLATVYVQEGINTDGAGQAVKDHIVENVWVSVADPEGYQISSETIIPDLLNATVFSFESNWGVGTVLLRVPGPADLYYQITGNFDFNPGETLSIKGGTVTGIAIGTLEGGYFSATHAYSSGFNFSAKDFFDAVLADDFITLNSFFASASYDFIGNSGADILVGSDFRDTLSGGMGDDILTGNGGRDTFIYNAGDDTITDFTIGQDKIDLTSFNYIHSMADIGPRARQDGANVVITFGEGESLTLEGVSLNDLSDGDFVFFQPPPVIERPLMEGTQDSSSLAYQVLAPDGASATFVSDGWLATPQGGTANPNNGHYYKFISGNLSWTDAHAAALAMGGYLVTIGSSSENSFVHSLSGSNGAWIGATDSGIEGHWVWANGPEGGSIVGSGGYYGYTGWWGSEPNGGIAENYAFIDHNGAWTDVPNTYGSVGGYVVEFNGQGYIKVGTYGTAIFNPATGELTYTLDNSDLDTQALAGGQTVTESFDLTFIDTHGHLVERTATFTVQGNNDTPVIFAAAGDSVSKTLAESEDNTGLTATGTLHVQDVDAGTHLTAVVHPYINVENNPGLSQEDLLSFFHVSLVDGEITWTFDSGNEAFNALGADDTMTIHYEVRVSDEHGAWNSKTIDIVINGANDAPELPEHFTAAEGNAGERITFTLSALDDSSSVKFAMQDAEQALLLGTFQSEYYTFDMTANDLRDILATNHVGGQLTHHVYFTPFESGDYSFTFTAIDSDGAPAESSASVSVHAGPRVHWQNAINGYTLNTDNVQHEFGGATLDPLRTQTSGAWTDTWWINADDGVAIRINGQLQLDVNGNITSGTVYSIEMRDYDALNDSIGYARMEMGNLRIDAKDLSDAIDLYKTNHNAGFADIQDLFSQNPYSIQGDSGNDILQGYAFDDSIRGYDGNDTIVGGGGNDSLTGGSGSDTFVFNPADGHDTIRDFTLGDPGTDPNADVIELVGFYPNEVAFSQNDSGDLRIVLPGGQWIDLSGIPSSTTLTSQNLHIVPLI